MRLILIYKIEMINRNNQMPYLQYTSTYNEIKIVDPKFNMTKEEYDKIEVK